MSKFLLGLGALCLAYGIHLVATRWRKLPLPPGPAGYPFIGNLLDSPSTQKQLGYKKWGDIYGPIMHYKLLTDHIIVLNNRELASNLLDKRSGTYADRQPQPMCGELMSWNRGIALCRAGATHRIYRKLVNNTLSAPATKHLWPVQQKAAHSVLSKLLHGCSDPQNCTGYEYLSVIRLSVGMNVVGIIFGSENSSTTGGVGMSTEDMEQYIDDADKAHSLFAKALVPFTYAVDYLPWLKHLPEWVPFAKFKKDARVAREELEKLTMEPFFKTRERIRHGFPQVSFVDTCYSNNSSPTLQDEDHIAWAAMGAYTGGSDTTIASVTSVILCAALFRNCQILAQKELDEVVGHGRLPTFEDRDLLPYLSAFVQECMRRLPAVPTGVAHRAAVEDEFEGYRIPKGSTIVANIWGMLHDESIYATPFEFDPTRFLPATGTATSPELRGREEPTIGSLPFGFGRRICPGQYFADSGIWMYAASILWAFKIELREPNGFKWEDSRFSDGAILYPLPFKANFTPRSAEIERLLIQRKA